MCVLLASANYHHNCGWTLGRFHHQQTHLRLIDCAPPLEELWGGPIKMDRNDKILRQLERQ